MKEQIDAHWLLLRRRRRKCGFRAPPRPEAASKAAVTLDEQDERFEQFERMALKSRVQIGDESRLPVRALARTNRNIAAASFIGELADAYIRWFTLFLECAAAHVERAQRVADRFRRWRASKQPHPAPSHLQSNVHLPRRSYAAA